MTDHIYKVVEIVGSSAESIEGAIGNALNRASATLRDIRWFEVTQIRGHVVDNAVGHYQVSLKLGFTLEDAR
jgi:dodecin